jgi:hypothetical protein
MLAGGNLSLTPQGIVGRLVQQRGVPGGMLWPRLCGAALVFDFGMDRIVALPEVGDEGCATWRIPGWA